MEDFFPAIIVTIILMWFMFSMSLTYNYDIVQQDVENIVFQYTQIASKKGILQESVYEEMIGKIEKYGTFDIYLTAEKFNGASKTELKGDSVIDRNLREEGYDLLTITAIAKKRHPISLLYSLNMFMRPNGNDYDIRLFGRACVTMF